jgi:hypothetical protein
MLPFLSNTMALELVVPWSKARINFSMKQLLCFKFYVLRSKFRIFKLSAEY